MSGMPTGESWRPGPKCATSGAWTPPAERSGLDWPAVKVLIDAGGGRLDVDVRRALRVMERTSRQIWDERRPTQ